MNVPMKTQLLALVGLAIVLLFAACSNSGGEEFKPQSSHLFTLPSAQGGNVSLNSYIGEEYVVLVFYEGLY